MFEQIGLLLLLVFLSVCARRHFARMLRFVDRPLARAALSRSRSPALVVGVSLIFSMTFTFLAGIPRPVVHDEFSYLLAADTFAHGRLTNPRPPCWEHFESMHILLRPTYMSKYPPGQGLVLAAGQVLAGQPIFGVWLCSALAAAAVYWMLLAWLRPRWALLGGLLAATHPLMVGWTQQYWGGSVSILGGALILGGVGRLRSGVHVRDALLTAAGMAILANSRPFEGLVLTVVAFAYLAWSLPGKKRVGLRDLLLRVAAPMLAILLPTTAGMAYYNWRVTGEALEMPYMLHEKTYAVAPPFLWQAQRPEPPYHDRQLREFHARWEADFYRDQRSWRGFLSGAADKLLDLSSHYFAALLVFPLALLAIPWVWRNRAVRLSLLLLGLFAVAILSETWMHPHYAAPLFPVVILLLVQGIRSLRLWRWQSKPSGLFLWRAALLASFITYLPSAVLIAMERNQGWNRVRAEMIDGLEKKGGKHLVLVRYGGHHALEQEWVYNGADLEKAPVIWARLLGRTADRRLLAVFGDRRVWLLEADARRPELVPYLRSSP